MSGSGERPAVSVVVPFAGTPDEAEQTLAAMRRLALKDGDELVLADNTPNSRLPVAGDDGVRIVRASELRSSYYARNVGAEATSNPWLLFVDADCRPPPDLVDRYFELPLDERVGAVAGEVAGAPGQDALAARYARSRRHLVQEEILKRPLYRPMAVTANLLVRREAWSSIGGFHEGIVSGGDGDFSWRLQDAGWRIEHRPEAKVLHLHRETLRALLRQAARNGAGWAWAIRRHPDYRFPNLLRRLARSAAGVVVWTLTGRFERATFKAVDALWVTAETIGYLLPNSAPRPFVARGAATQPIAIMVDEFPVLTETFVATEAQALARAGASVRVEASSRPAVPMRGGARGLHVDYWEDDGILRKVSSLAWLVLRHPLGALRDARDRRHWSRREEVWPLRSLAPAARRIARGGTAHLHAHFAAGAALNALRLSRLIGVPYSVTVHAYDVFQEDRNLREKLERAAFATSVCAYTVDHLCEVVSPETAQRIHEVGMGIDPVRFRRRVPQSGGRCVLAVGRLIEKKGFAYLIEAAARLERDGEPLDRVTIVGDGPLAEDLRAHARELGVEQTIELVGTRQHDGVRELIERCDVLAAPSIIARDGDRDSLPVVVEEALALEVPVVASALGGLPEVVRPEWGRLVAPGDAAALADALGELLAIAPERRAEMGRAGRAFILEHRNADREAARLSELIRNAAGGRDR